MQAGLQGFAKPWNKLRAIRVFRDKTSLAMTPALWPSIQSALEVSEYFLLLASVESAKSPWVEREVTYWLEHRSVDKLLLIVTSSSPILPQEAPIDFDWIRMNLLPARLAPKFVDEPLYLDLRWKTCFHDVSILSGNEKSNTGQSDRSNRIIWFFLLARAVFLGQQTQSNSFYQRDFRLFTAKNIRTSFGHVKKSRENFSS